MRKMRIAFYGFGEDTSFPSCLRGQEEFLARHFNEVGSDRLQELCSRGEGPIPEIREFNPHILVIHYPGSGLDLYRQMKEYIYFLPLVLSMFDRDTSTLELLQQAGIVSWQIVSMKITPESFATQLIEFSRDHIDK